VRIWPGQLSAKLHKHPRHLPVQLAPVVGSSTTGLIPKERHQSAAPGLVHVPPGSGVHKVTPGSSATNVSTMGNFPLPTTSFVPASRLRGLIGFHLRCPNNFRLPHVGHPSTNARPLPSTHEWRSAQCKMITFAFRKLPEPGWRRGRLGTLQTSNVRRPVGKWAIGQYSYGPSPNPHPRVQPIDVTVRG